MSKEWSQFLLKEGVLKFGDFTLKDGSKSPFFLDFGALGNGSSFQELGRFFSSTIEDKIGFEKVDFLYGPPYKAVMLAGATAMSRGNADCYFSRKEQKTHGEGGTGFGHKPKAGESYVLLDDVMSSGGTKFEALEHLADCNCLAVVVGVDREHEGADGLTAAQEFTKKTGVPVYGLVGLKALCQNLEGAIGAQQFQEMRAFCGVS